MEAGKPDLGVTLTMMWPSVQAYLEDLSTERFTWFFGALGIRSASIQEDWSNPESLGVTLQGISAREVFQGYLRSDIPFGLVAMYRGWTIFRGESVPLVAIDPAGDILEDPFDLAILHIGLYVGIGRGEALPEAREPDIIHTYEFFGPWSVRDERGLVVGVDPEAFRQVGGKGYAEVEVGTHRIARREREECGWIWRGMGRILPASTEHNAD